MEPLDRLLEAVPLDEPHRVERPAVGRVTQPVHRHDPRVLQPAGHLGLELEPGSVPRVVGEAVLDLLERHVAVQLGIQGHEDLAQPSPGMRTEDAEPSAGGRRLAHRGRGDGPIRIIVLMRTRGGDVGEALLDFRVGDPGQVVAHRADRAECGQALLGVVAVHPDVLFDERLQELPARRREGAAIQEDPAQPARTVGHPRVEGTQQGVAIDEVILERQQPQQEVTRGVDPPGGRIRAPVVIGRRDVSSHDGFSNSSWLPIPKQGTRPGPDIIDASKTADKRDP